MGLFDFLKPLSHGFSGLKDALGPHVQAAPGAVTPGNFGGTGAAGAVLGGAGDDGLLTAGVQRATPLGGVGPLQQAPELTRTPGLLERLGTPDARGLTFGDKLFAAGSIAQGDSSGAMSQLQNRQIMARQQALQDQTLEDRKRRSAAFKAAMATGKFDPATYAQMSEDSFDPDEAAKLATAFRRQGHFMNANNGLYYVNEDDPGNPTEVVKGQPKPPGQFVQDPETGEWGINPDYVQLQEQIAAARRRGAPPVGRRSGGGSGRAPKSYGADDVSW